MSAAGPSALAPVLAFLRAQRAPYLASAITAVHLPGGRAAIRFTFSAPSPLGLLAGGGTTP